MHHHVDSGELEAAIEQAADLLRRAERVAVLSGAGVSVESGIATFRGTGGLWEGHRIEDVATPEAFERDPRLVWRFYNMRRQSVQGVQPNPGHRALAELENRWGSNRFTLATQNIDGLHHAAGSRHVLELHGRLSRVRCIGCGLLEDRPGVLADLPRCDSCAELLRPDIVWFGEALPEDVWLEACQQAARSECFLVVGTSAVVYPAAGLIEMARRAGAAILEFNIEPTDASALADVGLYGPSGRILPELVRHL